MICSPKTWLTVKGLVLIWHFCTLLEHREHFIEHALFTPEFPPPLHSKPFVPNIHTLNRANRVQCLTQDISVKERILTFNLEQPGIEQSTFQ